MNIYKLIIPMTIISLNACGKLANSVTLKPVNCTVVQNVSGSTITCPDGTTVSISNGVGEVGPQGISGLNGVTGSTGATGDQGVAGSNGTNATPVTIVQLCKGFTPTYPNIFPESILCLGTTAWGIYSANGGFGTVLEPGTYSSDGINASCTFTLSKDCVVTQ